LKAPVTKKRTSARAKSARTSRPQSTLPKPNDAVSAFPSSKKDKIAIKHASFVSRIEKAPKVTTRRRPNKKLVANLESLADALPGLNDENEGDENGDMAVGQAKIQRKSLKSRPGATKRKEKLEKMEIERFNANLVQMASTSTSGTGMGQGGPGSIADRWAALKNHVRNTTEVRPEFFKK
jgi:hypothetical protein